MTKYDIGLLLFVLAIGFDLVSLRKEVRRLTFKLMDMEEKPKEDSWMERRKNAPSLSKEELDKIMTPEEKELRKKLFGSEYPKSKD